MAMADAFARDIRVESIDAAVRNPRRKLQRLDELAASIAAYGLMQPIVVRPTLRGRYEVIAGHRRLAAVRSLGWTTISATVRESKDEEAFLLTLIENLQRDDLSPREESSALEALVRERGWSTRQVAHAVKRSPAYVSKRLRVFEDEILAPLVLDGKLAVSTAEELLALSAERKRSLAEAAIAEGWDRARLRAAAGARQRARPTTIGTRVRQLRKALRDIGELSRLSESDRAQLRMLYTELTILARAPAQRRSVVIPAVPTVRARSS